VKINHILRDFFFHFGGYSFRFNNRNVLNMAKIKPTQTMTNKQNSAMMI